MPSLIEEIITEEKQTINEQSIKMTQSINQNQTINKVKKAARLGVDLRVDVVFVAGGRQ